jgi:hypothetical protein
MFNYYFYSPKPSRITLKIVDSSGGTTFFSGNVMSGSPGSVSVGFDSDNLPSSPVNMRPNLPSAGTYMITVTAERDQGGGVYVPLKTLMMTVTAS